MNTNEREQTQIEWITQLKIIRLCQIVVQSSFFR
jgi:hypothetical protein